MSDAAGRLRFWLGMLQMFGAVAAMALLLTTGISAPTLAIAVATTAVSLASRRRYRDRRG
jgi:hypothetical protein